MFRKVLLLSALALIVFIAFGIGLGNKFDLFIGDGGPAGNYLQVKTPVVHGVDTLGRPFRIRASLARQQIDNPQVNDLEDAIFELHRTAHHTAKGDMIITANTARLDNQLGHAQLSGEVTITDAQANIITTPELRLNTQTGDFTANGPLVMDGPKGRLRAVFLEHEAAQNAYHFDKAVFDLPARKATTPNPQNQQNPQGQQNQQDRQRQP